MSWAKWLGLAPLLLVGVVAESVNVTFDDSSGQTSQAVLSYSPAGAWEDAAECSACFAQPATSSCFDGTYHHTTADTLIDTEPTFFTFDFTGTGVFVYCVIANNLGSNTGTKADYSFSIDNQNVGRYTHTPDPNTSAFQYNVPVYANDSIPNGQHTLVVTLNGGPGVQGSVLMLLDYITFTVETGTSSTSSTSGASSSSTTSTQSSSSTASSPTTNGADTTSQDSHNTTATSSTTNSLTSTANNSTTASTTNGANPTASRSTSASDGSTPTSGSSDSNTDTSGITGGSSQGSNTKAIVAGVVSAIVVVIILILAAICYRKRRANNLEAPMREVEPFITATPGTASSFIQDNRGSFPPASAPSSRAIFTPTPFLFTESPAPIQSKSNRFARQPDSSSGAPSSGSRPSVGDQKRRSELELRVHDMENHLATLTAAAAPGNDARSVSSNTGTDNSAELWRSNAAMQEQIRTLHAEIGRLRDDQDRLIAETSPPEYGV